MVTRSQGEGDEGNEPEAPETTEPPVVELDEAATAEIVRQFAEADFITALTAQIANLTETVKTLQGELAKDRKATDGRLKALEVEEDDKQRQWLEDMPRNTQMRVTYRPRVNRAPENEGGDGDEVPASEKAKQVTNNIAGRY